MSESGRITSERELREELDAVADRARDAASMRDGAAHSVPNDDEPWSVADILGEMMAGAYGHGSRVDLFGYVLYNGTVGESGANVWTVHPPNDVDDRAAIDALNLDQFATASEIESYLLEGTTERE